MVLWVNFGGHVLATLYFGWHYVADDIAGIVIALLAFYLGGIASGQKFDRHGLAVAPHDRLLAGPHRRLRTASSANYTGVVSQADTPGDSSFSVKTVPVGTTEH